MKPHKQVPSPILMNQMALLIKNNGIDIVLASFIEHISEYPAQGTKLPGSIDYFDQLRNDLGRAFRKYNMRLK